jgi:hypothetical protein
MKKIFFLLSLFSSSLIFSQSISFNNGSKTITLSMDYQDAYELENMPIIITNTVDVNISGEFESYGINNSGVVTNDVRIIASPNTSIAVVENITSPNTGGGGIAMPPKNGTTVIRSSAGGPGIVGPRIALFPNPINDILNVSLSSNSIKSYGIYDFNGLLVISESNLNKDYLTLNLEPLRSGKYIIQLELENGKSKSIQFIKE